jgi:hypothetical protein
MLALTPGDLQGVGVCRWSPGMREGAIQVPENVCSQRWEVSCRGVRLPLTPLALGEGDRT